MNEREPASQRRIGGADLDARIRAIDERSWDPLEAAILVAAECAGAGVPHRGAARLENVARAFEAAGRTTDAAVAWERLAALEGLDAGIVESALVRRARAFGAAAESQRQAEAWRDLEARARAAGDVDSLARALYHRYAHDPQVEDPSELLDEGAAPARSDGAADAGGWSWRCRALQLSLAQRFDDAIEANGRALARARSHGDTMLENLALDGIGYSLAYLGRRAEAIDVFRQSISLCEHDGDLAGAMLGRANIVQALCQDMLLEEAMHELGELRSSAPTGVDRRWRDLVDVHLATVELLAGRVGTALDVIRRACEPVVDGGCTISDLIALQAWFDAAGGAGDLVGMRKAAGAIAATVRRIGGDAFSNDVAWAEALVGAADGDIEEVELARIARQIASDADDWLHGVIANEAAWRGLLGGDVWRTTLASIGERREQVPPLIEARRASAAAALRLLETGDDRGVRAVRHRLGSAGFHLDGLRLELGGLVAGHRLSGRAEMEPETLRLVRSLAGGLEECGALRDSAMLAECCPELLTDERDVDRHPLLEAVPAGSRSRAASLLDELRLESGRGTDIDEHGDGPLLVRGGIVRIVDASRRTVGVAGDGGWIDVDAARSDGAVEVIAATESVLLVPRNSIAAVMRAAVDQAVRSATGDDCSAAASHVRPDTDVRRSARERIAGIIEELVRRWGSIEGSDMVLVSGLAQEDLAALAGTSRKSATVALGELRSSGRADARRGRLTIPRHT